LGYIFVADSIGLPSTSLTQLALKANVYIVIAAVMPLNTQGHQIWYQSIARMRLLITE